LFREYVLSAVETKQERCPSHLLLLLMRRHRRILGRSLGS
jgi:hypothetical protein